MSPDWPETLTGWTGIVVGVVLIGLVTFAAWVSGTVSHRGETRRARRLARYESSRCHYTREEESGINGTPVRVCLCTEKIHPHCPLHGEQIHH